MLPCTLPILSRHRNPTTHSCNPPPPTISAAKAHTQSLIASLNPASSKPSSSAPLLSSASPATKPPPPKKRKVNPALELMRLKQQAKAGSRGEVHERSDRWHLKIGVDLEGETVRRKIRGEDGEEIKDGTYWRKVRTKTSASRSRAILLFRSSLDVILAQDLTVGQIIQSLVTSRSISHNPIAGDPSTVRQVSFPVLQLLRLRLCVLISSLPLYPILRHLCSSSIFCTSHLLPSRPCPFCSIL